MLTCQCKLVTWTLSTHVPNKATNVLATLVHLNFPGDQILENLYLGFKKDILKIQIKNFLSNKNKFYNERFKNIKIFLYWDKIKKNRTKNFHLKKRIKYLA